MIEVQHLSKTFQNKTLYNDISFTLQDKMTYALVGQSGSGKTTLLNMLSGLDFPTEGKILVDGQKLSNKTLRSLRQKKFGYIFQNYGLIDKQSIYDNLVIGLKANQTAGSKKVNQQKMNEQLKRFNLDYLSLDSPVYTLSGGEQQRIALIRLILKEPSIVFADEPTGSLDKKNSQLILEHLMTDLKDSLRIIATHDMDIAQQCDYQIIIENNDINIVKN